MASVPSWITVTGFPSTLNYSWAISLALSFLLVASLVVSLLADTFSEEKSRKVTGARSSSVKEAAGGETGAEQSKAGRGGSFVVPRHLPGEATHVPPYPLN